MGAVRLSEVLGRDRALPPDREYILYAADRSTSQQAAGANIGKVLGLLPQKGAL